MASNHAHHVEHVQLIVIKVGEKYIDIDQSSGGYPSLTDFRRAYNFPYATEAAKYLRMFQKEYPNAEIITIPDVTFDYRDVTAEVMHDLKQLEATRDEFKAKWGVGA